GRGRMLATGAEENAVGLGYVNLVGGQDELVFDGQSLVISENGRIVARGKLFEEDLIVADINAEKVFKERLHDPRRRQERIDLASAGVSVERIELREQPFENARPRIENRHARPHALPGSAEEIYQALVIGARDYVRKNGVQSVIIGSSGGIDSALTACIAVDAPGPEHVPLLFIPTLLSSS